jgi:hypothetical protein
MTAESIARKGAHDDNGAGGVSDTGRLTVELDSPADRMIVVSAGCRRCSA